MFWPFADTHVAVKWPGKTGNSQYLVFPHDCHAAWMELALYLGKDFNPDWAAMAGKDDDVNEEFHQSQSAEEFYHHSQRYLYHLTQYYLEGWKRPGYSMLLQAAAVNRRQTVLDYGCGIGSDGLLFLEMGIKTSFADLDNPSRKYLEWRLSHRMTSVPEVYDVEHDTIPHHDIVWCMDVLEHLPPQEHRPFLDKLLSLGNMVIMNLVDDKTADGSVHHAVDVDGLVSYLEQACLVSHFDMYEKPGGDGSKVRFLIFGKREQ